MNPAKRAAMELSTLRDKIRTVNNIQKRMSVLDDYIEAEKQPAHLYAKSDVISMKEQLAKDLAAYQNEVQMIKEGLAQLEPEQQFILNAFYMMYPKHSGEALEYLCTELRMNERSVWDKKKEALNRYAQLQGLTK